MTSQEMSAQYNPAAVESAWYSWWEKEGMFKPQLQGEDGSVNPEGMYSIVLPPPNVTGSLHLGHALMDSIEDCIVRYQRMMGKSTLFVPGIDHAGIATQVKEHW